MRGAAERAIFLRVAGPDATATRARIHETPGPRWFPAGSAVQRVHGDASMFVGGLRALLLQSLHPLAMAGVAAHSGYRGPLGRLQRTSTFIATTTFGTADDAARAVAAVRAVHERVRGVAPDGRPYRASDPDLLRWVHVAETQSFLVAHQEFGHRPLDAAGCDEYVAQAAVVGRALGVEDVPVTVRELDDAVAGYRPVLGLTPPRSTPRGSSSSSRRCRGRCAGCTRGSRWPRGRRCRTGRARACRACGVCRSGGRTRRGGGDAPAAVGAPRRLRTRGPAVTCRCGGDARSGRQVSSRRRR